MNFPALRSSGIALLVVFIMVASFVCMGTALALDAHCADKHASPTLCAAMTFHTSMLKETLPAFSAFVLFVAILALPRMRVPRLLSATRVSKTLSGVRRIEPPNVLVELFSQGILHPKRYG